MSEQTSTSTAGSFKAVLTPHRSLSRAGFLILMIAIGLVSFFVGFAFLWNGAWPVLGFFGLDVAIIYWAFRANYRSAHEAETIEVTPETVRLTRSTPDGTETSIDFNTYWVRVAVDERRNGRTALRFVSHGQSCHFGRFLTDDERRELADILANELIAARSRTSF